MNKDVSVIVTYQQALGDISAGRVLDVATGRGSFVRTLKRSLQSYTEIVGIDVSERALKDAQNSHGEGGIHFLRMDAERLAFRSEGFAAVCAAKSIHHWTNVPQVLREMVRVLRPSGHLVLSDLHRNVRTEAQRTDMYIHHFGAEVHRYRGFTHNTTFTRRELVGFVEDLDLSSIVCYDWSDTDSNPMDADHVCEKENLVDRILQDARDVPNYEGFKRRGEQLRQRLHTVGIQSEPVVVIVGTK